MKREYKKVVVLCSDLHLKHVQKRCGGIMVTMGVVEGAYTYVGRDMEDRISEILEKSAEVCGKGVKL